MPTVGNGPGADSEDVLENDLALKALVANEITNLHLWIDQKLEVTVVVQATEVICAGRGARQSQALEIRLGRYCATYDGTPP